MHIETLIVGGVVAVAAIWLTWRTVRKVRSQLRADEPGCVGGCDGCGPEPAPRGSAKLPVVEPLLLAALLLAGPGHAADTIETFDVGATDLEFYVGLDGLGPRGQDRTLSTEVVAGFGIVDGLSLYLATALEANHRFVDGSAGLGVGLFGTPLDTDHFDIDLVLDVGAAGPRFSELSVAPMAEFNMDLDPDMGSWGVFVRAGVEIAGRAGEEEAPPGVAVVINPGTYLTLGDRHQLLLEYDMAIVPATADAPAEVDVGGLAVGYNVVVAEPMELVGQLYADLPQKEQETAIGLTLGFVATLPSPARARGTAVASAE